MSPEQEERSLCKTIARTFVQLCRRNIAHSSADLHIQGTIGVTLELGRVLLIHFDDCTLRSDIGAEDSQCVAESAFSNTYPPLDFSEPNAAEEPSVACKAPYSALDLPRHPPNFRSASTTNACVQTAESTMETFSSLLPANNGAQISKAGRIRSRGKVLESSESQFESSKMMSSFQDTEALDPADDPSIAQTLNERIAIDIPSDGSLDALCLDEMSTDNPLSPATQNLTNFFSSAAGCDMIQSPASGRSCLGSVSFASADLGAGLTAGDLGAAYSFSSMGARSLGNISLGHKLSSAGRGKSSAAYCNVGTFHGANSTKSGDVSRGQDKETTSPRRPVCQRGGGVAKRIGRRSTGSRKSAIVIEDTADMFAREEGVDSESVSTEHCGGDADSGSGSGGVPPDRKSAVPRLPGGGRDAVQIHVVHDGDPFLPPPLQRKEDVRVRRRSSSPHGGGENGTSSDTKRFYRTAPGVPRPPHGAVLPCDVCTASFRTVSQLESHLIGRHAVLTHARLGSLTHFSCAQCARSFRFHAQLDKHVAARHERGVAAGRPHRCTACPNTYRRAVSLKLHTRAHQATGGAVRCSACDKSYATRVLYQKHIVYKHEREGGTE